MGYKTAGVDIDKGNDVVDFLKTTLVASPYVKSKIGGYNSIMSIPSHYTNPLIVSSTDGVGSKVKLASELGMLSTIGEDLVAMVVNDIVCSGAEPAVFLDTISFSELSLKDITTILSGIQSGCQKAGCVLVGGETAEMPGMYAPGEFDLTGFGIGYVEDDELITPALVKSGDVLLGIRSSGMHSNGFSLIRQILKDNKVSLTTPFTNLHKRYHGDRTLGQMLLDPTTIYSKLINNVLVSCSRANVHGIAHITGGGLTENIPRVLPENMYAEIDMKFLPESNHLYIFDWIKEYSALTKDEMLRTFNCGIGMVLVVDSNFAAPILEFISGYIQTSIIGVVKSLNTQRVVYK